MDDYIQTPDGRKLGRMDHIFKGLGSIKEAQVIQEKQSHCRVRIVVKPGSGQLDEKLLKENFFSRVGEGMDLTLEIVNEIPRGVNGKFKGVINELALRNII